MIKWGVLLLAVILLVTVALQDNGQVSIAWGEWIIETSLLFLLVILIVLGLVLYALTRLWTTLVQLPKRWRERRTLKRNSRAEQSLSKGLVALEYGDWRLAEKQLIRSAKFSEQGLVHYLSAAKMAHNQSAFDRRNQYIKQARELFPDDVEMIGLVEARLLMDSSPDHSIVILQSLYKHNPKNKAVLKDLSSLLVKHEQWQSLETILPNLKKQSVLSKEEVAEIEELIIANKVASATDCEQLDKLWNSLKSKQQLQPKILTEFVEQRMGWGAENGLETLISKSLKNNWDNRLVYQFGRLNEGEVSARLKTAQGWLVKQAENPVLLLTLGRLACQNQLWVTAHNYFKLSLQLQPELETYHALANCYEKEGLESQAALTYKTAILALQKKSV